MFHTREHYQLSSSRLTHPGLLTGISLAMTIPPKHAKHAKLFRWYGDWSLGISCAGHAVTLLRGRLPACHPGMWSVSAREPAWQPVQRRRAARRRVRPLSGPQGWGRGQRRGRWQCSARGGPRWCSARRRRRRSRRAGQESPSSSWCRRVRRFGVQ